MLFHKKNTQHTSFQQKPAEFTDGLSALLTLGSRCCDAVLLHQSGGVAGTSAVEYAELRKSTDAAFLTGEAMGLCAGGQRTLTVLQSSARDQLAPVLNSARQKQLPLVLLYFCDTENPAELLPEHDAFFHLHAGSIQQAVDLATIALKTAETALLPGLVSIDAAASGRSLQPVRMPDAGLLQQFLGNAADEIPAPTRAQRMIFGETRPRVPRWLDPDRPLGIGLKPDEELAARRGAAEKLFFATHLQDLLDASMQAFSSLSGREYSPVMTSGDAKGELLVLSYGRLAHELSTSARALLAAEKKRLSLLSLLQLSPFPSAAFSHFLLKRKALTLLEPGEPSTALANAVRASITRVLENSRDRRKHPWAGHAYGSGELPALFHGAATEAVSTGALRAVIANMLAGDKQLFFLGSTEHSSRVRVPALQARRQEIQRYYPHADTLFLQPAQEQSPAVQQAKLTIIQAEGEHATDSGRMLAEALHHAVSSSTAATFTTRADSAALSITLPAQDYPAMTSGLVTDLALLQNLDPAEFSPALILLNSPVSGEDLWRSLPERWRRWIQEDDGHLFSIDAQDKAGELGTLSNPSDLISDILAGALITILPELSATQRESLQQACDQKMAARYHNTIVQNEHRAALQYGIENVVEISWQDFQPIPHQPLTEPAPPWTVEQVRSFDKTVYDLNHFYESTGFLYATGRQRKQLTDPFTAIQAVPARSIIPRQNTRPFINLIRENAHDPEMDWEACYEAGLHRTLNTAAEIFEAGIALSSREGGSSLHLPRLKTHIIKQAYKLFLEDKLHRFTDAGTLFQQAGEAVIQKLAPQPAQREEIEAELERVTGQLAPLIILRTERFFDQLHQQQKGSGMFLCVAIDPDDAGDPSACLQRCPQNTVELVERTAELEDRYRQGLRVLRHLPATSLTLLQQLQRTQPEDSLLYFLNRRVRTALPASLHAGAPGKALFMLAAAIDALWLPRMEAMVKKLRDFQQQLEEQIQDQVSRTARINDFERFAQELGKLENGDLDADKLLKLADSEPAKREVDGRRIRQMTETRNRLNDLIEACEHGSNGDGRARAALVFDLADLRGKLPGIFPDNPFSLPWIDAAGADAAGLAAGLLSTVTHQTVEAIRLMRTAGKLIAGALPEGLEHLTLQECTDEELALCPPVILISEEKNISRLPQRFFDSGLPVKIMLLNTSPVPVPQTVTFDLEHHHLPAGSIEHAAEPVFAALQHRSCFVLQSTTATGAHLFDGMLRALAYPGPALLHIFAPDFAGQTPDSAQLCFIAEHAVHSRTFPLLVYDPGLSQNWGECFSLQGNPHTPADNDWPVREIVFTLASGALRPVQQADTFADWALNLHAWQKHFRILAKDEWDSSLIFLAEYLSLPQNERAGRQPYIQFADHRGAIQRAAVSDEITALCQDRLRFWNTLREFEALERLPEEEIRRQVDVRIQEEKQQIEQQVAGEYEQKMHHLQQEHDRIYHAKLRQRLLQMSGFAGDSEELKQTLKEFLAGKKIRQDKENSDQQLEHGQ